MAVPEAEAIGADLGGRYAVVEVLGHGTSATVFLAVDPRHQRRVALKVLSAAIGETLGIERFQREILTVARLQHPNILPLFDSGTAAGRLWYTMPFVESGSLRDHLAREPQMSVAATTLLVREVAEALTYAHGQGVIHRDIKPENIMLSAEGHALLADFGLARAIEDEMAPSTTGAGIVVGTPLYMSPEQALGEGRVDARADVYALATVAYEMLAGATPFEGESARLVMTRRVLEPPPSARLRRPDLPKAIDAVLLQALARNPAERYGSAAEFAAALTGWPTGGEVGGQPRRRWLTLATVGLLAAAAVALGLRFLRPGPPARPSAPVIAVLPFKNLGPAEDQYFADGLTEEITSRLAGVPGLRVISRTSADQYRNTPKPLKEIGQELGAAYLLEGSVRWERATAGPGRVRVTPQLIRVADDTHLWADAYDAELTRIFALQAGIAEQVTSALDLALQPPERTALTTGGTSDPEAYDYYLRGNEYQGRGNTRATLTAAAELYGRAVARDPRFALAFARLSNAHAEIYWYGHDRTPARIALARRAADSALALAPELPEGHIALGTYYYRGFRDYARALEHFEVARRRQPSNGNLLAGIAFVERRRGRWDEAIAGFSEALRYDPRSNLRAYDLGSSLIYVRRFAEAERQLDRAITLAPEWGSPYAEKAQLYVIWRGDLGGARAVINQALSRIGLAQFGRPLFSSDQIVGHVFTSDPASAPLVDALTLQGFAGDTVHYYFLKAESARFRRLAAAERVYADSLRTVLEHRLRTRPDDPYLFSRLGIAYAALGRKADAIRAGSRSVELMPVSRDALVGPYFAAALARTYMMVNEPDLAAETLAPLLEIPSPITRAALRVDPLWAPLREHPRFRKLMVEVSEPAE